MGFLDNAGLARLWGKVTARRRVLTAAEYAALSEEEKNADVVYMVPEEGGGGSSGGIPSGCILIWSGEATAVPDGWHICDGTEGTPDLRGRFVVGTSYNYSYYPIGSIGGEATHKLTSDEMPSHNHTITRSNGEQPGTGNRTAFSKDAVIEKATYTTIVSSVWSVCVNTAGNSLPHNNLPPYYALCYIMKL